eukprot:2744850-Alexandrium_andersonii.AAC.1
MNRRLVQLGVCPPPTRFNPWGCTELFGAGVVPAREEWDTTKKLMADSRRRHAGASRAGERRTSSELGSALAPRVLIAPPGWGYTSLSAIQPGPWAPQH